MEWRHINFTVLLWNSFYVGTREVLDKDVWIDTDKDQGPSSCPHWPRHIVCVILKNTKTQKMQEFFISFYKDKPDSCMKTKIKLSQFWSLSIIRNCSNLEMPARVCLSTLCTGTHECRHPASRGRRNHILCWKHLRRKEGLIVNIKFYIYISIYIFTKLARERTSIK